MEPQMSLVESLESAAAEIAEAEVFAIDDEDTEDEGDPASAAGGAPSDAEAAFTAIQQVGAKALLSVSSELREDREFMVAASRMCPLSEMLRYASEKLRIELYADREFVLRAVEEIGATVLEHASKELRADLGFMMEAAACSSAAEAMKYASEELRMELDADSDADGI
mmetsp:Transcript_174/g.384  ORF Transcript_174/g.384 Transcript_174/m.384 type:complete len:168 (+) Transcript_174:2146-2649(+)